MTHHKIIAVVANGEPVAKEILIQYASEAEMLIAADGGVKNCISGGVQPDLIIGDLDSLDIDPVSQFPGAKIHRITDQDSTDLEKVLGFIEPFEPDLIRFFSVLGLRADHMMANMILVQNLDSRFKVEVYDNHGKMTRLQAGCHRIRTKKGKTVSFFSMNPIKNLSLSGFHYPLKAHSESVSFFGISNVTDADECQIDLEEGTVIMYELFQNDI